MSATITIGKDSVTSRIVHIDDVNKNAAQMFICAQCAQKLTPVKSKPRKKDWHFRHQGEFDFVKCSSRALHDFAVQLLMDNSSIVLDSLLRIEYSNSRKECWPDPKYRSDVTVNYNNEDVHFEIYVTHDLEENKIVCYRENKIKCVRIDLSDRDLLSAPSERIRNAVLNEPRNKKFIYWNDDALKEVPPKASKTGIGFFIAGLLILAVLNFLRPGSNRRKRRG